MVDEDYVYSRIGMALISSQRLEFITGHLLEHLIEFDKDIYGITTEEFFQQSSKSKQVVRTLGNIFKFLKLNPKLVIANELDEYLEKRNVFIHRFWEKYLFSKTEENAMAAVDFCYDFGRSSDRITDFFKGFLFFLALRHVKDRNHLDKDMKFWDKDFEYFLSSLDTQHLE